MSWDLDEQEAVALVEEYLAALDLPADDEWVITEVAEFSWGWVISWANRRYVEGSQSTDDLYAGGGPCFVDRRTDRVAMAGSAHSVEYYIELWRAGKWPDGPLPR